MTITILVSISLLAIGTAATKQAGSGTLLTKPSSGRTEPIAAPASAPVKLLVPSVDPKIGAEGGTTGHGTAAAVTVGSAGCCARPQAEVSADPVSYWHSLAVKRLHLLGKRERRIVHLLGVVQKLRAGRGNSRTHRDGSPASIICRVFGSHCREAIAVATCESGLNVYARNGQYLGLFQMGEYARAKYGHAWNAWTQARAAYRYFLDAGWSPWECKP